MSDAPLLSADLLRKLQRLEILSHSAFVGRMKGERRSPRKGTSIEFADHRPYVVGDDLRFIDWNILARLDRLFLKLFEEEEDLSLYVLVDRSLSMDFGTPTKFAFARQVAAALAFVGLLNHDRVVLASFADTLTERLQPLRGQGSYWRATEFLEKLTPAGGSDLAASCKRFAQLYRQRGVAVLLTDLMDKRGFETALRYLVARRYEILVVNILSQEELNPELAGDMRLTDVEDHSHVEVTASAPLLRQYHRRLDTWLEDVHTFCTQRQIAFVHVASNTPVEELIFRYLRERQVVR